MDAATPRGLTSSEAEALLARWGPNESASRRKSPLAPAAAAARQPARAGAARGERPLGAARRDGGRRAHRGHGRSSASPSTWSRPGGRRRPPRSCGERVAPDGDGPARRTVGRAASPRARARRRHPPLGRRSGPRRRAPARGARPSRARGRADGRVAAGREGGCDGRETIRPAPSGSARRSSAGSATALVTATGQRDAVRRRRRAPRGTRPRDRVRARAAPLRPAHHAHGPRARAGPPRREPRDAPARVRVAALRRRPRRGPDARVLADDHDGDARAGRVADGAQHVIVKHLAAIQNLGSIDVLCSDKTGTLTVGEMRVEGSYDAATASPSPRPLALARLNSRFQTGHPQPARRGHPRRLEGRGRRRLAQARRGPLRLRAPPPVDRRRAGRRALPRHQGRARRRSAPCAPATPEDARAMAGLDRERGRARAAPPRRGHARVSTASRRGRRPTSGTSTLEGFLAFSDPPLPEAKATVEAMRARRRGGEGPDGRRRLGRAPRRRSGRPRSRRRC